MEICLEKLKKIVKSLNEAKILVIGDLALDEMVYGASREILSVSP